MKLLECEQASEKTPRLTASITLTQQRLLTMASLDMLLESLNEEDKKTRRVPDRTMSGDTLDSIKNHRRHNYKAPPAPVGAGGPQRTTMSRRGARRPTKTSGGSALSSFVESMNESQKSFQDYEPDPEEETVDSRQLVADKLPQLKASARRGKRPGRIIAKEDVPQEEDEDEDEEED